MPQSRSTPVSRAPQLSGLGELVYHNAHEAPQAPLFSRKADGQWHHVNATEFLRDVTAVAKGLIAAGVGAGDRVVLGCATGYEWTLVNFAIWAVRGVVVPVHPACSRRRLHHILRDCRPAAAVVESDRHAAAIAEIQHELLDLGRTWRLADDSGLEAVTKPGAYIDGSAVRLRRDETTRADPAAISYPVTTAPDAPGSVLTHGNFLAGAESLIQRLSPLLAGGEQASTLMHLPLADVFGHSALVGCVMARVRVGFCERGAQVRREVRMFRPTVLLALPRLLEQVYAVEKAKAKESGWDNLNAFNAATELAVDFDKSGRRGAWRRVSRVMYEWMYSRIKEALGGRVRFIVVGGGQLPARLTHFYGGAGLPVLQGFGTVQTTGAFVLNAPGEVRVGTVGRPVPGVEVRLSREAEVLVRGATVFAGHHGRAAGAGPGRDGWLATGVFGRLDSEGYLVVDERPSRPRPRPEVDAGPGPGAGEAGRGPAPAPAAAQAPGPQPAAPAAPPAGPAPVEGGIDAACAGLETRLGEHPLISQVLVMAQGRPYATALITLKRDQLEYWRLVNSRPLSTPLTEIAADPQLGWEIQRAVEQANAAAPAEAAVRAFHILGEEFSPRSGLLLPSGRLRRDAILRAFAEEIEALYQGRGAGQQR